MEYKVEHPHHRLVYNRKLVGASKKIAWGDPSRLEQIHRTLRQAFVFNPKNPFLNENFRKMDKDYPNTVSIRGFSSILVNAGVLLSEEVTEVLFAFYDAEGHGSLDMNDFLVGLRYNLAMNEIEANRIISKLERTFHRGTRRQQDVDALFLESGLPRTGIAEKDFVRSMKSFTGNSCTTSELLFVFSLLSGNDRNATVDLKAVTSLFFVPGDDVDDPVDVAALELRLGKIIYDRRSSASGRIGLMRMLARGDKDFNGSLNPREFAVGMKSFGAFTDRELTAWFNFYDPNNTGRVWLSDLVSKYRLEDYFKITQSDIAQISEVVERHIRHRSPGPPGLQRTYDRYVTETFEKYDPHGTGFFDLETFLVVIEDLCSGDLRDIDIEILFEHCQRNGKVDWQEFLKVILGTYEQERELQLQSQKKWSDPLYEQELLERTAVALYDRNRQAAGHLGLLRIELIFDRYDLNHTGQLSVIEFRRALRGMPNKVPLDDCDIDILFKSFDTDDSGTISYQEFLEAMRKVLRHQARERSIPNEVVVPPGLIEQLTGNVADSALKKKMGTQGLLVAFGKYDKDGNGYVDKREFVSTLRWVCDPVPTEEELSMLFDSYDVHSQLKVSYSEFISSLDLDRFLRLSESEYKRIFAGIAAQLHTTRAAGSTDGLRRVFEKHDRSGRGKLSLAELLKALQALGYHGSDLHVEYAFLYISPTRDGVSCDQFLALCRGTLITDAPTSRQVLLERLHKSIYGDTLYATMSVAKGMVRLDRDRTGKITLKDFKTALKGFGSQLTESEATDLFRYFDLHKYRAIEIKQFVDALRGAVKDMPTKEKQRMMLNIIGTSVQFRNQGLGSWLSRFEPHDHERNGRVDLVGYSKAVELVDSNKMSDFEKESLFNCYAGPDDTMDYRKFVHDVLEHPLNRSGAQFYTGDSLLRSDYNRFDKKEKELQEKELVRAGSALKADRSLVKKLYQAMYLPSREALGTLRLVAYFQKCQNGTGSDRYLKKKDFVNAILGLVRHDNYISEYEIVALFEQLQEGGAVDVPVLLQNARMQHKVELTEAHHKELMKKIHDQMWYSGKRDVRTIRPIFRSDVRHDGFMDLNSFTVAMLNVAGGMSDKLEWELLFNSFSEDRKTVNVEKFCQAITPPGRQYKAMPAGPGQSEIQNIITKLAAHIYDMQNVDSGTIALARCLKKHDRDRDEYLNRKDFLAAIQSLGCATVCPPKQLNILFDAICEGEGAGERVFCPKLLELIKGAETKTRVTGLEYKELVQLLQRNLPSAALSKDLRAARTFERWDPKKTRKIALAPFTDALYMMMNPDTPVRDVQIETVFDLLDKDHSGTINYMEFLEVIAGLPVTVSNEDDSRVRVVDTLHRKDPQSDMVFVEREILRQPAHSTSVVVPTPFESSDRMLYLDQGGMRNWHDKAAPKPDIQPAGGFPSVMAREASHTIRYGNSRGMPPTKAVSDWEESGKHHVNFNPEAQLYQSYIPRAADHPEISSEVSLGSALPPYLSEANSMEEWMSLLGLSKYLPLFKANEIDLVSISELQERDLQDMGMPLGPRKKVLKAAKMMK